MSMTGVCFAAPSSPFIGQPALRQFAPACLGAPRTAGKVTRFSTRRARVIVVAVDGDAGKNPVKEPLASEEAQAPLAPAPPVPTVSEVGLSTNVAPFSDNVPGKIQLDEIELARQRTALDKYTMELRKKQMAIDREAARLFGFVPYAETLNGRLAMFFIVTGVLTEYWTGYTLPQQVELMLRTLGIL